MTYYSLRWRTFLSVTLALGAAIAAIVACTSLLAYRDIAMQRDMQMEQAASILDLLLKHETWEGDQIGDVDRPLYPKELLGGGIEFRVLSANGKVSQSSGMPNVEGTLREGFSERILAGTSWRILRHARPNDTIVEVAEPYALRIRMTRDLVLSFVIPIILLIAAAIIIVDQSMVRMLRPLSRLSFELDRRDAKDLSPVLDSSLPIETRALIDALNSLLVRLDTALEHERAFSDNAAHELRTPLAVLKTRAQLLEKRVTNDPALLHDVHEVVAAVDRASALIDRMLELVRLSVSEVEQEDVDLSALTQSVARELAPLALDKGLEISADISKGVMVHGIAEALTGAVRNLIENAIRYTPSGGRVEVSLVRLAKLARITVTDNGIGIPEGAEARIFQRFHRGESGSVGAGLGLALVEAAASRHGGKCHVARGAVRGLSIGFDVPL